MERAWWFGIEDGVPKVTWFLSVRTFPVSTALAPKASRSTYHQPLIVLLLRDMLPYCPEVTDWEGGQCTAGLTPIATGRLHIVAQRAIQRDHFDSQRLRATNTSLTRAIKETK
jgi:hypothetical protein